MTFMPLDNYQKADFLGYNLQSEPAASGCWVDCQGLAVSSEKGRMQCAVQLFERSGGTLIRSLS